MPETQPQPNVKPLSNGMGWLFGTFNPIHNGHVAMARAAITGGHCQQVMLVPSAVSPWKKDDPDLLPYDVRCAMAQLAVANEPDIHVSLVEGEWAAQHPGQPTISWEIVLYLHHQAQLVWPATLIMGQDSVAGLGRWAKAEEMINHCHFLQAPRLTADGAPVPLLANVSLPDGTQLPLSTTLMAMAPVTVSSSDIRQQVKAGQTTQWRPQVHPGAAKVIVENKYWSIG